MASSINNTPWMDWIESLMQAGSRQTFASTLPADQFYCLLDELPLHLIPRPSLPLLRPSSSSGLVLNAECQLLSGRELPSELSANQDLVSRFTLQGTIAWVGDGIGNRLPFWLGPELEEATRRLKIDAESRSHITDGNLALLCAAGILVNPEREAVRMAKEQAPRRRRSLSPSLRLMM